MANRNRNPAIEHGLKVYIENDGEISNKEIAELVGATPDQIRKWKCVYKWKAALEESKGKRNRGGQKGNKNAKGHGAPVGNENALTHGAYKSISLENISEADREMIESITLDTKENLLRELKTLLAKENDLRQRIEALQSANESTLFVDKEVELQVPENENGMEDYSNVNFNNDENKKKYKTTMNTIVKSSAFERAMKLEIEYSKIHGRIIKLIDTIKSFDMEERRLKLDEKKYEFMKQKALGVYDVPDEPDGEEDGMEEVEVLQ